MKNFKKSNGVTLIELLIGIAIVAVVCTVLFNWLGGFFFSASGAESTAQEYVLKHRSDLSGTVVDCSRDTDGDGYARCEISGTPCMVDENDDSGICVAIKGAKRESFTKECGWFAIDACVDVKAQVRASQ